MKGEISIVDSDSPLMEAAFELRLEVFVVEQGVPLELEIDEHDEKAVHLVFRDDEGVVATLRLLPHGKSGKIGRVAVRRAFRGKGIGTLLVKKAMEHAASLGIDAIVLDAQLASMPFYEKLGFAAEGAVFQDAGIPHMRMRLKLP